jgi:hypothetical protein
MPRRQHRPYSLAVTQQLTSYDALGRACSSSETITVHSDNKFVTERIKLADGQLNFNGLFAKKTGPWRLQTPRQAQRVGSCGFSTKPITCSPLKPITHSPWKPISVLP